MSKIVQMPKSAQRIAAGKSSPEAVQSNGIFQLPVDSPEDKAGFERITKWLELADAVLNETSAYRKRA